MLIECLIKELGYTIDCDFFSKWDGLLVLVDNDKVIFDPFQYDE